ncbi:hypothetical protein CTA1_10238 [Colletotrichum tanaceti]|uniref:Uncharacterized protein n=1 Tax=Colletotrichum tanaceti TaxID=1306861 RepID=A0A4U6XTT3_9PEZI|nr:hypothetical protein CTA1_10238 [Colletotrichum tanaceti]
MRSLLRMLVWLSTRWLVAELLVLVSSGNDASHAYERLYLWTRYDAFCEIYGAKYQRVVLPHFYPDEEHQKPWPEPRYNNRGSDIDNKYTFGEFQRRIHTPPTGTPFKPQYKYAALRAPWYKGDKNLTIDMVAGSLLDLGLNTGIHAVNLDPYLESQRFYEKPNPDRKLRGPSLWDAADRNRSSYSYYLERVEAEFQLLRREKNQEGRSQHATTTLKKNIDLGNSIIRTILQLRDESSDWFLYHQLMSYGKLDHNLGIPKRLIRAELDVSSQVPHGRNTVKTNIVDTMTIAWNNSYAKTVLEEKGFHNVSELVKWATNFGNPDADVPYGYSKQNIAHYRLTKTWRWALAEAESSSPIDIKQLDNTCQEAEKSPRRTGIAKT